jgi:hypothetical protein
MHPSIAVVSPRERDAILAELRVATDTETYCVDSAARALRELVQDAAQTRKWNPAILARALRIVTYEAAQRAVGDWHEAKP